jgi:hypothetical protein
MPHRDAAPGVWRAGKEFADRIGQRQLAVFDLQHHRRRRELFAERPGLKQRLVGDNDLMFDISEPVALRGDHAVALDHGHRHSGNVLRGHLLADDGIECVGLPRL